MKISLVTLTCLSVTSAFSTTSTSRLTSALNLFGGGNKDAGEKKGPGMMDQLAMFKKAQEMAQKKKKLDEELMIETFIGEGADGKVKGSFKYVPVTNPMDPNPDYEPVTFEFDDEFFESASPDEISNAVKESIFDGITKTNEAVAEKYAVLQGDLMEAFGQGKKE